MTITASLVEQGILTWRPCSVCGGCTDKEPILAEIDDGEHGDLEWILETA